MSTVELSSGNRARAWTQIRARSASREIFGPPAAFIAARAAISSVASASTQQVASGISVRLRDSLSATAPRTPRSGTRSPDEAPAAEGAGTGAAAGAVVVAATGRSSAAMASSTSARRIRPSGPDPRTSRRSSPRSLASFRTRGEMTGTGPSPWPAPGTATGAGAATGAATAAAAGAGAEGFATAWLSCRTRRRRAAGPAVP